MAKFMQPRDIHLLWEWKMYFGPYKMIWTRTKYFGLDTNLVWTYRRTGQLISVQLAVHARSRSTMRRVIVNVILVVEFSGTIQKK